MKIGTCNQTDIPTAATSAFASKKLKTSKNVLDKRALAASIAAPALQFLQAEKRKHVRRIGLTSCWHNYPYITIFTKRKAKTRTYNRLDQLLAQLPSRYDFYNQKSENRYLQLAWHTFSCCPHVMIFISGKTKTKHVLVTGLIYLQLLPLYYNLYKQKCENKYVQLAWHTCSYCLHVCE